MGNRREMSADPVFAEKLRGYKPARAVYWNNWNACCECDYLFRNCNYLGQCPRCGSYDTYKPFSPGVNWVEVDRRRAEYKTERESAGKEPVDFVRYKMSRQKVLTRFA